MKHLGLQIFKDVILSYSWDGKIATAVVVSNKTVGMPHLACSAGCISF